MSDWIDNLKMDEDAGRERERHTEAWRLRCDALIDAKAPDLWREVAARVSWDAARLREKFPSQSAYHLEFDDHNVADHFTLANVAAQRNFEARWNPAARVIRLEFRRRADVLSPVQVYLDEIRFEVTDQDKVRLKWMGVSRVESISEKLIRKLL